MTQHKHTLRYDSVNHWLTASGLGILNNRKLYISLWFIGYKYLNISHHCTSTHLYPHFSLTSITPNTTHLITDRTVYPTHHTPQARSSHTTCNHQRDERNFVFSEILVCHRAVRDLFGVYYMVSNSLRSSLVEER